ncbi:putative lipoprotein [Brucella rhizosphaerae]|uniref:Putative lipoprotein n=2 Tax=Brucella rhizosphaerae TaxID=571254 RepID=A0A256FDC7_9HYPH|nr:putative lipoprotein [Brucella rhizosphaerae]
MNKAHLSMMLLLAGLLAACNSTESALNVQGTNQQSGQTTTPPAGQADAASTPVATAPAQTTTPATPPTRTASLKPGKLYIAPIIGAPVSVVTPLTHRINDDARAKSIELAGANGTDAAYVMKGYFSVLSEDNQTTVLYVWDVMDASGNRLHRIQGQEKVPGASADSWSIVPPSAMQSIADKTMQQYSTWLAANRA